MRKFDEDVVDSARFVAIGVAAGDRDRLPLDPAKVFQALGERRVERSLAWVVPMSPTVGNLAG
jgi:hypothetical protein